MSFRKGLSIAVLFLIASLSFAAIAQQPPTTGATVHGMVVDPDDALVPGATMTLALATASGKPVSTTSKSDGTYTFRGCGPLADDRTLPDYHRGRPA